MRIFIITLLLFATSQLLAQEQNYWVLLSDKSSTPYSIDSPEDFLSQAAIDRRLSQDIAIDVKDLPVDPSYVSQIAAIEGLTLRYASRWFNAVAVSCEQSALTEIEALPFVGMVRSALTLRGDKLPLDAQLAERMASQSQNRLPINYGLSENQVTDLNGQYLHEAGYEGDGMVIAILDSGFDNVDSMDAFAALRDEERILSTQDFVDGDTEVYDEHSHGRYVLSCIAGIIEGQAYGTATQASFHLLRTEDVDSESTVEEYNWIAAAEYADSVGADVLNTSLGYTTYDDESTSYTYADMDGNTAWITRGADMAASVGMLVINSAGNSGNNEFFYIGAPADGDSVLAIGAIQADSTISTFSSHGPSYDGRVKPNVCAQGSAAVGINENDEVVFINGTSFSSPILAGLATCLWQAHPEATNMQVFEAIEMSAHLYDTPDDSYGYGIPNFGAADALLDDLISSVDELEAQGFALYPNPATGDVLLRLGTAIDIADSYLSVFDTQGRLMFNHFGLSSDNSIRLDTSSLPSGTYVVQLLGPSGAFSKVLIRE